MHRRVASLEGPPPHTHTGVPNAPLATATRAARPSVSHSAPCPWLPGCTLLPAAPGPVCPWAAAGGLRRRAGVWSPSVAPARLQGNGAGCCCAVFLGRERPLQGPTHLTVRIHMSYPRPLPWPHSPQLGFPLPQTRLANPLPLESARRRKAPFPPFASEAATRGGAGAALLTAGVSGCRHACIHPGAREGGGWTGGD
jgi:hypothetical protein